MTTRMTIEFDARFEPMVQRALAMAEEMEQLALSAPDGAVFDACELAVVEKGREFNSKALGEAIGRRIEVAEKKGRRSGSASAVARKKTVAPKNGG